MVVIRELSDVVLVVRALHSDYSVGRDDNQIPQRKQVVFSLGVGVVRLDVLEGASQLKVEG
jgi:hypothetical protein